MRNPYQYPLRSRKAIIEYLTSGFRYDRGYHERYSLSFDVKAYNVDLDFDHLWEKYSKEYMPDHWECGNRLSYKKLAKEKYEEVKENLWDWGQEGAWRNVDDGDCYRMLWSGTVFDTKFGLAGRSGGHLVVTEWNNYSLDGTSEDFDRDLEEMGWEDLRNLYKMVCQWEVDFTSENASAEVEYQAAFTFFVNIVDPEWYAEHDNSQCELPLRGGCCVENEVRT